MTVRRKQLALSVLTFGVTMIPALPGQFHTFDE